MGTTVALAALFTPPRPSRQVLVEASQQPSGERPVLYAVAQDRASGGVDHVGGEGGRAAPAGW
jgi:hypothetical protein